LIKKQNINLKTKQKMLRKLTNNHSKRFYQKYIELRARIKANSCPVLPATPISGVGGTGTDGGGTDTTKSTSNFIIQRSASLKDHRSQLLR
jgi:hypothetical protein